MPSICFPHFGDEKFRLGEQIRSGIEVQQKSPGFELCFFFIVSVQKTILDGKYISS